MVILILVLAAVIVAYLILIFPGRASRRKKRPFSGQYFANRGLHGASGAAENSMEAFHLAVEAGYGIKLDARLTSDDKVIVFRAGDMSPLIGEDGAVEDKTYDALKPLKISGTQEGIPLLEDVLDMVSDRVPVMVELINSCRNQDLCIRSSGIIAVYKGDIGVVSFHPGMLAWYRKNSPRVFRGLMTCQAECYDKAVSKKVAFMISRMLTNVVSRPQFIAFRIGKIPFPAKLCYALGAMRVGWTCRKPGGEGKNDAVIFEGYYPSQSLK